MPTKQEVEAGKQKIAELMDKGMSFMPEGLLTELGKAFTDLTKALSEQKFNSAEVLEIMANINNGIWDAKINTAKDAYDLAKLAEEEEKIAIAAPVLEEKESAAAGEPVVNSQQKDLDEAAESMSHLIQMAGSASAYSQLSIRNFLDLVRADSAELDNGVLTMPQAAFDVTKDCKFHWPDTHVLGASEVMSMGLSTLLLSDEG